MVEILQFMLIAVLAGFLGSLVGLGGGIIITPAVSTDLLFLDISYKWNHTICQHTLPRYSVCSYSPHC